MRSRVWLLALALVSAVGVACNKSESGMEMPAGTVRLSLTASQPLGAVDHYTITIASGGQSSMIHPVAPAPPVTLDIDVHASGTVQITVEADDASGTALGQGTGSVQVSAAQTVSLTVELQPA